MYTAYVCRVSILPLPVSLLRAAFAHSQWQKLRGQLISKIPLYGRKIHRWELPRLDRAVRTSWELFVCKQIRLVYLIQGEEDASAAEAAMWNAGADVLLLTFQTQRSTALYFPNSTYSEGRNVLRAAAAIEEANRGCRYTYYIFVDADAEADPPWPETVSHTASFVREWQPAVAVPETHGRISLDGVPRTVFGFDHIFLAIHAEAAKLILPYNTTFDRGCWFAPQFVLTILSSILYKGHVLAMPEVRVVNPHHSDYPKNDCIAQTEYALTRLRLEQRYVSQNCFPKLNMEGLVKVTRTDGDGYDLIRGNGDLNFVVQSHMLIGYVSWGKAQQKQIDIDYSNPSPSMLVACEHEPIEIFILDRTDFLEFVWTWCRGCDINEALETIQLAVSQEPYNIARWHRLASLLAFHANPIFVYGVYFIAWRLCLLQDAIHHCGHVRKDVKEWCTRYNFNTADAVASGLFIDGAWDGPEIVMRALTYRTGTSPAVAWLTGRRQQCFLNYVTSGQSCD